MRYDVIVVGAGPAGSTAARECAERGLSVLLLDKAAFPRDKPCGGGVNVRTVHLLPFDVSPVTERIVTGIRLSYRGSRTFTWVCSAPLTYLTQRRRLDAFLVEQAVAVGAALREKAAIRAVERQARHVVVRAGGEVFEGWTLVAADGAHGPTAHLAGLGGRRWLGVALEGNATPPAGVPAAWGDHLGIDVAYVPGGYGWLFPKGDHVNLGVYGWRPAGPDLRSRLAALTRCYGFDPDQLWGLRGHHLPVRAPGAPLVDGNVLLVGDAAGLVDPFTGEGIYAAVWSGRAAADQIVAYLSGHVPDLRGYAAAVERDLEPDLTVARQVRDAAHLLPGLAFAMIHWAPGLRWFVCRLVRGEETHAGFKRRFGPFGFGLDLVAGLARSAPLRRRAAIDEPVLLPTTRPGDDARPPSERAAISSRSSAW